MKIRKYLVVGIVLALLLPIGFQFVYPGTAFGKKDSTCSYEIPIEKAAAILGVEANDLNLRAFKQPVSPDDQENKTYKVPPCSYHYKSKSDFLKSIGYVVYVYNRPEKARSVFNTMRGNFKTVAKVESVQGLGEKAFWVNDKRFHRLVALKGGIVVDVVSPKKLEFQKRVVQLLLRK